MERSDESVHASTPTSKRARISDPSSTQPAPASHVTPATKIPAKSQPESPGDKLLSNNDVRSLLINEAGFDAKAERSAANKKRPDYISWDDFFFGVAILSSRRSKNPVAPYGACIVDVDHRVVGIGYDGLPAGCADDCIPYNLPPPTTANKSDDGSDTTTSGQKKLPFLHKPNPYICHAEVNAILNKCNADVAGCRMYVERFPCNDCAKMIVQSRIREVIYLENRDPNKDTYRASRILFGMAGVKTTQYAPTVPCIDLQFVSALAPTTKEMQGNTGCHSGCCPNKSAGEATTTTLSDKERFRELMIREANYDPVTTPSSHRTNCISWDDYFLAMAFLTARRSKDPNTQVGAVIVHAETKRILALGYNGFPRGCSDDLLPWARQGDSELHKKYLYVCHAEVNAVLNKGSADVKGATLYVALFPCSDCAKTIIQAGIQEVVYMSDQYHDTDSCRASRIMFQMAGVRLRKHIPAFQRLSLQLKEGNKKDSADGASSS